MPPSWHIMPPTPLEALHGHRAMQETPFQPNHQYEPHRHHSTPVLHRMCLDWFCSRIPRRASASPDTPSAFVETPLNSSILPTSLFHLNRLLHGRPGVSFVNLIGKPPDQPGESLAIAISNPQKLLEVFTTRTRLVPAQETNTTIQWVKRPGDANHCYASPTQDIAQGS